MDERHRAPVWGGTTSPWLLTAVVTVALAVVTIANPAA